jgi:hypothetical protein
MRELEGVYGVHALEEWEGRLATDRRAAEDLSDTKERSGQLSSRPPMRIDSFGRLVQVASFLSVMNKTLILLYRGQKEDHPLLPSLFRPQWRPPGFDDIPPEIGGDRLHYWDELASVESIALRVLESHGLPRWRHLRAYRSARWAVIQHYELWPTPLLDFTSSLRVAASFAFDFDDSVQTRGMLYVVGVRKVRSDLMPLTRDDADEQAGRSLTIRLNAVCPPSAQRPHLQEGFLVGRYPFERQQAWDQESSDAASILVAKIALTNDGGFWNADFPIHTRGSLIPGVERDALLSDFRTHIKFGVDDSGKASLGRAES